MPGHTAWISAIVSLPEERLASSDDAGDIIIWNMHTLQTLHRLRSASHVESLTIISVPSGLLTATNSPTSITGSATAMCTVLISCSWDGTLSVWSIGSEMTGTASRLSVLSGAHTKEVYCVRSYGPFLASGSWDQRVVLWNTSKSWPPTSWPNFSLTVIERVRSLIFIEA